MPDQAYVYILSSSFKKIYPGVTTRLNHRVTNHKSKRNHSAHTSRYQIDKLIYYDCYGSIGEAIARETQIKGWLRIKKVAPIVKLNPEWRDLSLDWNQPMELFNEENLRPPSQFTERVLQA